MECREAPRIPSHDVSAFANQQIGYGKLSSKRGVDERRCLVGCPDVDISTCRQELLDGGGVSVCDGVEQGTPRGGHCRREDQRYRCKQPTHDFHLGRFQRK
ncbi:MAG: hypothetical protein JWM58_2268 [Rhizobium sp.]|nr:hypothetical protein [Rhizobium sp.]